MNSEKTKTAWPKSKQTKTRILMKNEYIVREKYQQYSQQKKNRHRGSVTEESSRNGAGCGRSARRQASDREVSALLALLAVGPETIDLS